MEIVLVLLPLCLLLGGAAVVAFFWAVRSGQFDDLSTPAWRILFDDSPPRNDDPPQGNPKSSFLT